MKLIATMPAFYCDQKCLTDITIASEFIPDNFLTKWSGPLAYDKIEDVPFSHNVDEADIVDKTTDVQFDPFSKGYFVPMRVAKGIIAVKTKNRIVIFCNNVEETTSDTVKTFLKSFSEDYFDLHHDIKQHYRDNKGTPTWLVGPLSELSFSLITTNYFSTLEITESL